MRLSPGILAKLFAAILLTNVATAVAVGLGVRSAFDSGFERYVREREDQRLERLAASLAEAFRRENGWGFLRNNDGAWFAHNHAARDATRPAGPGHDAPRGPPRALVLDDTGAVVAGDADPAAALVRRPITLEGRRIGWIATPALAGPFDRGDRRFREQHWEAVWLVAAASIALAALVAGLLAWSLLAPVKRIAAATRRLADGDYATRVEPRSADELGRLAEDFNRLGNALGKNEAARRRFMADASHELRTPIAVLKGEIEALQDGVRQATPEALASLQAEVARLGKLVDDLHELSVSDAGGISYRFAPVDLVPVVREAIAAARARLEAASIAASVDAPRALWVRADALRLHQVVANLLENTLRYTDGPGRLQVELRRDGTRAVVAWRDSAPGVAAEAMPRIFDRFFRVEASRNRDSGGSGLGLAIAKSIVEAHGGAIAARPSELGGLAIEVRLPLGDAR